MIDASPKDQPQRHGRKSTQPHALALFRILFGVILCASSLAALVSVPIFTAAELLFAIGMLLFGFCIVIGAWLPYTAVILALLSFLQWTLLTVADVNGNILTTQSQALLFAILLLALAWSRADRAYSYRMLRKYGSALEWEDVRLLPHRLLQVMIAAAYLYIGIFVLWQSVWVSGARLRSALIGPLGTTFAARLARSALPTVIWSGALATTKAFSLLLPVGLWLRSVRTTFMVIGLLFHLLIGLFLGKWWLLTLTAGYPLFWNPDAVRLGVERISSTLQRKKAA